MMLQYKTIHKKDGLKNFNLLCSLIFFDHFHTIKKANSILNIPTIMLSSGKYTGNNTTNIRLKNPGKTFKKF